MISKLYTRQLYQAKPSGIIDNVIIFFYAITVVILYCALDKPIWFDEIFHFCLGGFSSVDSAWHALKQSLTDWNHGQTGFYMMLDYNADKDLITKIKAILESDSDTRLTDIHAWKLGSQKYAAIVSIEPLAK